jgi:predicted small lipoprotein YifL
MRIIYLVSFVMCFFSLSACAIKLPLVLPEPSHTSSDSDKGKSAKDKPAAVEAERP